MHPSLQIGLNRPKIRANHYFWQRQQRSCDFWPLPRTGLQVDGNTLIARTPERQPARLCQSIRTHRHHCGESQRRSTRRPCWGRQRQGSPRLHPWKFNSQGVSQLLPRDDFITVVTLQSISSTDRNDCASTGHKNLQIMLFPILPKRRGQIWTIQSHLNHSLNYTGT